MQNSPIALPLVSLVIATYNGEKYLREQLDSIFNQTYSNLEVIAIDDCSSDFSVQILNEYASRHSNMTVFLNPSNLKHVKTFEKGISLTHGDYIGLCDQDDIWDVSKIEETMKAFDDGVLLTYCDSMFVDENGQSLGRKISDIKNLTDYDN